MNKLKTTRKHKSTEEGFSLVIATGFGLVIMLIGLTIMGRSIKDSSVSASQKTITRSLAAAESGVTQYLSFINQNRLAANFSDCVARRADGTCNDTGTTASWANPSGISATDIPTVESTILANSQQSWRNVVPSDPTKGQYRLLSYEAPDPPARRQGVLKVEGRVNQQGTSGAATNDVQTGKTRLQVNISVTASNIPDVPFPGVWLNNGNAGNSQFFQANGLLSLPVPNALALEIQPNYPTDRTPQTAPRTSIQIASFLPPQPISFANENLTARSNRGDVSLPATGDVFTTETIDGVLMKVYRYPSGSLTSRNDIVVNSVNSEVISGATTLPQKVIVYLDGDIDLQGNGEITHQCKKTDGSTASICDLSNFQIYGYNPNPTSQPRKIRTKGTFELQAFIIAPTYTACVSGGGNDGGFKGAIWVNSWNEGRCGNDSGRPRPVITQTGTWGQVVPFLTPQTFPPEIGVIGNQAISTN
ncbi:MAG: hypothetical protein LH613_04765 [Chamaesiphon sp.]|nr:hypothetical protein [Chamaesiphon sp.]